eukprot:scaffold293477_cov28-Tisochrysis_lutea.AAC.1
MRRVASKISPLLVGCEEHVFPYPTDPITAPCSMPRANDPAHGTHQESVMMVERCLHAWRRHQWCRCARPTEAACRRRQRAPRASYPTPCMKEGSPSRNVKSERSYT